jgi:site-specific DNA-methyltransferase (adenine-specific)
MPAKLTFNKIHQGDCIEGMKQLPDGCVDLVFADPPFNIGYEYDVYKDNRDHHDYLAWSRQWMEQVCRVLKPDGTFWLAIGDEFAAELKLLAQHELKLTCRSWVIWYYTFGVHCTKKFTRSHAHLFHFVRDASRFRFNENEISVPSARQLVYDDERANPAGRLPDDTWILRPQDVSAGFAREQQTWYFPRVAGTFKERAGFHGCQMPEQLLGRIIRTSSDPGHIVLDPFVGSGTSLAVAKKLARRWVGFELSDEYARQASNRVDCVYEGQPLVGAVEPVLSAPRTTGATSKVWLRTGIVRALIEAFLASSDGWSVDRVIADPDLNGRFADECQDLGLPGNPADWNRMLMRLRKAGKLEFLPRTRRTTFPDAQLDEYLFASEIAMRKLGDEGQSLDDILCDPALASRFDSIAKTLAPGPFSPLQYRWAALTVGKRADKYRKLAERIAPDLERRRFLEFQPLQKAVSNRLAGASGVYLARGDSDRSLYVGETADLARRLRRHLESEGWHQIAHGSEIGTLILDQSASSAGCEQPSGRFVRQNHRHRVELQSHRIHKLKPILNYLDPERP